MYNLIKEIRDKNIGDLTETLKEKSQSFDEQSFDEKFDGMKDFCMHQQNRRFVHFLLARITNYIEDQCDMRTARFEDYVDRSAAKPFEIEHIWSDRFNDHTDEFKQREDFDEYRNKLGALVLLPRGFNQSFGDLPYEKKIDQYFGQNMLARSLHCLCYNNHPSFQQFVTVSGLQFRPHNQFKQEDIQARQLLYMKICKKIWAIEGFDEIANG
jgi:hypothetical protein